MLAGILGAAATGVANLGGQFLSYYQDRKQAKKQNEFQADMSNTAVQRHAADLEAAGFNRLLAAGGQGASTPTGTRATAPNYSAGVDPMAIMQIRQARENISRTRAEEALLKSQGKAAAANAAIAEHDAAIIKQNPHMTSQVQNTLHQGTVAGKLWQVGQSIYRGVGDEVFSAIGNAFDRAPFVGRLYRSMRDVKPTVKPMPKGVMKKGKWL